jgi:hypothetical protein
MRRLEAIPVHLVPAFYQHAYDRILFMRTEDEKPTRALKAIGLYNIITHLLAHDDEASISTIARKIGMTYQGILPTTRLLERVGLVEINKLSVATPFIKHKQRALKRCDEIRRQFGDPISYEVANTLSHTDAPAMWHMAYDTLINGRGDGDTTAKALQCMGLLNIIARIAGSNVEVTKAMLAKRLNMAAHALTCHIEYLERNNLIELHEQRSKVSNAREYRIELPRPIVVHANRSMLQLWKQVKLHGWEDAARLRQMATELRRKIMTERGEIYKPLSPID